MGAAPLDVWADDERWERAMSTPDQWAYWRQALKGHIGPIQESNPQSGFYRHYIGVPVAIWRVGDVIYMLVDGGPVLDRVQMGRTWLSVAKYPVTKAAYDQKIATKAWPADLPEVAAPVTAVTRAPNANVVAGDAAVTSEPRGPGDNSGDLDTFRRMRADVLGDVAEAQAHCARVKVETKDDADKLSDWADRLAKSARDAESARKAEKAPLLQDIADLDARWGGIIEPATVTSKAMRSMADAWGKREADRLAKIAADEAKKKWEAQKAALIEEQNRRAAERPVQSSGHDGVPEVPYLDLTPPPQPVVPPPKISLGTGTYGNRRSVKTAPPETASIVDLKAAAEYLAKQQHPDLVELVQKIADRAVKSRAAMPGIRFSWQAPAKSEASSEATA